MKRRVPKGAGTKNRKAAKAVGAYKTADGSMKMTMYTAPTMVPRPQSKERRPGRPLSGKRLALTKNLSEKGRSMIRRSVDPCENSNDSGLGFDHHMDSLNSSDRLHWSEERAQVKRPKLDVKLENDDINDNYTFPEHTQMYRDNTSLIRTAPAVSMSSLNVSSTPSVTTRRAMPRCTPLANRSTPSTPLTLISQLQPASRFVDVSLSIICQPEQQHRARYQTEGSRGAVKDRSGNGFPVVQLSGYHKSTTLQVFIGSDVGKVAPHMFYQACRVSGKNSTPCSEKKIDGTIVIELQLDPSKEMMATCDCVGILKERNVDVEHRFPDQLASRSKKKSTRCRMIFRTTIVHEDGTQETLQVCSQPIVCTQPPGIPEISKKSLTSCPANGGLELFIIGKNFLKDTVVYFQFSEEHHVPWEKCVVPDKEFLQQTHLVCVVPPYVNPDIVEPVTVRLHVVSSGKTSEAHQFVYTPIKGAMESVRVEQQPTQSTPFLAKLLWTTMTKQEQDIGMMPPPDTTLVPLSQRRPSITLISSGDVQSPPLHSLKQELIDENSQNSVIDSSDLLQPRYRHISESSLDVQQGDSNMSMINDNSMDLISHGHMMHPGIAENENLSMVNGHLMEPAAGDGGNSEFVKTIISHSDLTSINDLRVIDLTMKLPMASVADLVGTKAPSMATLHSFGVTESSNLALPSQSAQSIENYLTNIEAKTVGAHPSMFVTSNGLMATARGESAAINEDAGPMPNPITSEKLDALVNCAVDTHISSHKDPAVREVMLTAPLGTIIPLTPPQVNPTVVLTRSPDIILNSQMSTSIALSVTEPEKAILLNAAADLLETQKKINDLQSIEGNSGIINDLLTTPNNSVPNTGANFYAASKQLTEDCKGDLQAQSDKKAEERMVPSSFATMSENDLINIINPSCFDQGNNFH